MRFILLKIQDGFIEPLGNNHDFLCYIENYEYHRWAEARDIEERPRNYQDEILTLNDFLKFIQTPVTSMKADGVTPDDRYKEVTETLTKFYQTATTHAECSHVLMTMQAKFIAKRSL